MDERKQQILQALIQDYIATGDPVGSRTIARKYDFGVSSATIRNEMADLEEMGFIEQPYTSAGRVPSQTGYRYYVDFLMKRRPLSGDVKKQIKGSIVDKMRETDSIIHVASKLLSQLTSYTALAVAPSFEKNSLRYIQLLPIEGNKIVLVIVLDNGHVEHRTMDVPDSLKGEDFQYISSILNKNLKGLSFAQWKSGMLQGIHFEVGYQKKLLNQVILMIESALKKEYESKVYLGGTLNILNQPEFKDVEKVKVIMELLEEDKILKEVLNTDQKSGVTVRIGTENVHEGMKNCSLVTATYELNGRVIGTLGVLGPTRMEYSNAFNIVEFITMAITEGINKL